MTVGEAFWIDTTELRDYAVRRFGSRVEIKLMSDVAVGLERGAESVMQRANARINRRTGKLQDTASHRTTVTATTARSTITWSQPYARWVEWGRGPVVAKRAKFLRFEIGGQVFFRKRVGPAPAQRFAAKGLEEGRPDVLREVNTAVSRWILAGPR